MKEHQDIFTIHFNEDADVHLNLVGEMDGTKIYRTIKSDYDREGCEKTILTLTVETTPLSEQHKRVRRLIKQRKEAVLLNSEENKPVLPNDQR